jgi:hypothetical protein
MLITTILITVIPLDRGRHCGNVDAWPLVAGTRIPLLDAARKLIRLGTDPDALIVMRHAGEDRIALRARLGTEAGLTIDDGRCRFRGVSGEDSAPPARQTIRLPAETAS